MATFCERVAHSVDHMFSLYFVFWLFSVLVLRAGFGFSGHCILITLTTN